MVTFRARPAGAFGFLALVSMAVACEEARGPFESLPLTRAADDTVVFAGAGNIGTCSTNRDAETGALLDGLDGFVFTAGDNAFPDGAPEAYADCYDPAWGRQKHRTYAVLGNHDYDLGHAAGALTYFGVQAGPGDRGYYSFDLGSWHVVVVNDNGDHVPFDSDSPQQRWLRADLASHRSRCTMALWHQPRFLSSNTEDFTERPTRKSLWALLYEAGVDVVVNGHQHYYERMAPMDPDGTLDSARGMRQFNVGTGGASLQLPTVAIHPNSEVRAGVHGVLKFSLSSRGYAWEFLPVAGQTFRDRGAGTCH